MDTKEKQIIEQVSATLTDILRGQKAKPIKYEDCPNSLYTLVDQTNELVYSYLEIYNFILPLSKGILDIDPPRAGNVLASPFKELHSQLMNLRWQVQQVARGDYKQRIFFMGEFSDTFNSMVEALEEKDNLVRKNIEQLKNEADRLRQSEARYASVVKNSPGGIYIFEPSTLKVIESNEKFNTLMGYSKGEVSNLTVYDFYMDKSTAREDLDNILTKSLYNIGNRQYRLKNGGCIDVDINSCWFTYEQYSVVIVSVQDVTERNKAQEAAAKYKVLLENARDIILFLDLDGRIIEANKAAEEAYGYSHEEMLCLRIYDLYSQNDKAVAERYMEQANLVGVTYETVNVRKNGSSFPIEVSSKGITIGNQKIIGQVIRDISDRKRVEESIRYFSTYDALTRVPNRQTLEQNYVRIFGGHSNITGALLSIDIDNFKFINDTFGHAIGDMVLVEMVALLKENLSQNDLLVRLGGDEFAVLLTNVTLDEAEEIAEKLRRTVEKARLYTPDKKISFKYTISIGVAPIYNGTIPFQEITSHADYALYQSKEKGRNRVYCLSDEQLLCSAFSETNSLMVLINDALEKDKIVLYYQPIVDISSGETIHYEALMRIVTENGDIVCPNKTIPIAERFGLMSQIDRHVVKLAFEALEKYSELKLFVNLSGASIGDEELLSIIEEYMLKTRIHPSRLGFEITETMAVRDLPRADRWIKQLRDKGCKFALDDFGIGFSSFSYLQYLSVDYIKIDGSYIHDLDKNYKNRALVQAMNTVARSFGIEVVAEFVENDSILHILREDGISHGQGYYLGQPKPVPQLGSISYN